MVKWYLIIKPKYSHCQEQVATCYLLVPPKILAKSTSVCYLHVSQILELFSQMQALDLNLDPIDILNWIILFVVGAALCIIRYLTISLTSTQYVSVAQPPSRLNNQKYFQTLANVPGRKTEKLPLVENQCIRSNIIFFPVFQDILFTTFCRLSWWMLQRLWKVLKPGWGRCISSNMKIKK